MNNQNNSNQFNLTPEQQQQLYYQQMMVQQSSQQGWNLQWNNVPQQYPQSLHHPPPNINYSAPPPPPDDRTSEPSFAQSSPNQNQRGNFNNSANRGKNKQNSNWSRGGRSGGNRGGNFSSNQSGNYQQGNVRGIQQNHGNYGSNNNQQNNRNNNQNWFTPSRSQQRNIPQQTIPSIANPTPTQKSDPSTPAPELTQEEIEFDAQFKKWEQEFDSWKKANVNHPDKNAYRQYEQQFESVRDKLLQRRAEMQKKKAEQQLLANPPKTESQKKFESEWEAGAPKVEQAKPAPEPQPSTSKAFNPPPIEDPSEFQENSFDDVVDFDEKIPSSSSSQAFKGIPGLEFILNKPKPPPKYEPVITLIDDDDEFDYVPGIDQPPPMATFTPIVKRQMLDLKELLEEPGRSKRPEKILILIRGAPGSGKTHMAEKILEKEKSFGNHRCTNLNINKFFEGILQKSMIDKYQENMMYELRSLIKAGYFNLIIVEVEGAKLMYFNKYVHIAITLGGFKCYVIEIHQPYDICMRYQKNQRSLPDVLEAVDDMKKFQAPAKTLMLDPTYLMKVDDKSTTNDGTIDLATNLAQLLQDENVMNLLQSELNKPKPLMDQPVQPPRDFGEGSSTSFGNQRNPNRFNQMPNDFDENQGLFQSRPDFSGPSNFNSPRIQDRFPDSFDDVQPPRNLPNQIPDSFDDVQCYPQTLTRNPNYTSFGSAKNQAWVNQQSNSFDDQMRFSQLNQQGFMQNQSFDHNRSGKENLSYNSNQPPLPEPSFDNVPTFTPSKIIDYKHAHIPTLYEQLMEFRVFKVVDYKHRTTLKLQEFIRDVDVDKIIEKRKQIALRKKTLEYLRNAERPEDTVSNPTYPRGGWIIINQGIRPKLKNKRKKKKTAKILRILASKEEFWMTKGYEGTNNMELDDISSDDVSSTGGDDFLCKESDEMQIDTSEPPGTSLKLPEIRSLKSALKVSENIAAPELVAGPNEEIKKLKMKTQVDEIHEEFLARLKQLIMVKGEYVEKNIKTPKLPEFNWYNREIINMREILEEPGRLTRPEKIMIVLRGAPGSGKTYLANLIERKEIEKGNREQFKLLSIDESFVTEETREYQDSNGMNCYGKYLKYDYDSSKLNFYMERLVERLNEVVKAAEYKFLVVDADCCDLQFYNKLFEIAKANNYVGYTIELNQDDDVCQQYNDHKRDDEIAEKNKLLQSLPTPDDHLLLDPEYLYNEYHYELDVNDDELMDVSDVASEENFDSDEEMEPAFGPLKRTQIKSKWDDEADTPDAVIERLDGTRPKTSERLTMAAYLRTDDEWTMKPSISGKKRVRWADIEEKKKQEKIREIGFIVGQTDWKRMTDSTDGKSALEQTKYIEPREKQ